MIKISKEDFEQNLDSILKQTIFKNTTTFISTDQGNAVLISEDDYYILNMILESDEFQNILRTKLGLNDTEILGPFSSVEEMIEEALK